jgi:hypothetical protein
MIDINESEINDIREISEFKGKTFSEFKKCDVRKELLNSLYKSKIEPSCYWGAELVCAGHYAELWSIIIEFYSKHVHLANPKLVIYLDLRTTQFKEIVNSGFVNQEIRLRNNMRIRKMFCEILSILCESKQQHSYDEIKVKKDDFDLTLMTERFKAPNVHYGEEVFLEEDPKELFIPVNELSYHLSKDSKNCVSACYWLEWIFEFENIQKSKKEDCKCQRRTFMNVDPKFQMDIVWLIWDIFLKESKKRVNLIQKIIDSTLKLFTLKYTSGCHKKRKLLLYFVVGILMETCDLEEEICKDKNKIASITQKINSIYKQIKQNEHSPGTDYLYKNVKASNLEKTIAKLETMMNFETEFIPRI